MALDEENATLSARVAKADRDLAVTTPVEDEVLIQRHRLEAYSRILPDDAEINDFVEQLTRSAAEARVQITELDDSLARNRKVRKGTQREAFARVTYRLKLAADMEGLLRFLDSFENRYARFVAFPTLSVESGSSNNSKGTKAHTVELALETYVYEPKTQQDGAVVIADGEARTERLIREGRVPSAVAAPGFERYTFLGAAGRRDPFRDPAEVTPVAVVDEVVVASATAAASATDTSASTAAAADAAKLTEAAAEAAAAAAAALALREEITRLQLEITGAILCAENAPASLVVINGRGYVAGELVEGATVRAVLADAVEFEFKGVVFRRALAARVARPKTGGTR